ncbi:MAG: hypothetical protein QMD12_02610 [Candidatus Aenigmarchaeota archaeon]|nr:hypothetical protein [Candidatus Aenigmarchaeota archaeon]
MEVKISKTVIALVFIFLMVGSTIAYSILKSLGLTGQTGYAVKLPEKNIIDYELDIETEKFLLDRGVTIVKLYYVQACPECLRQKSFLESFANQYSNQIILEEILSNKTTSIPNLIISSYRGQRILENATDEEMIDAFCDLMLKPPVGCAVRKI